MKCKERLFISGLTTCVVLLFQMCLTGYNDGIVGKKSNLVYYDGEQVVHLARRRKKLNKSNYTSDTFSPVNDNEDLNLSDDKNGGRLDPALRDGDIDNILHKLYNLSKDLFDFDQLRKVSFTELVDTFNKPVKKGRYLPAFRKHKHTYVSNWEKFQRSIHQTALYDPKDVNIDGLLRDLTFEPIVATELKEGGTQVKLIITYRNGGRALFKPMRFARDVETIPDHFYFSDYERHHAEIAAFHLDWVLGFYSVVPTAGRKINMTSEIMNVANKKLRKTFFMSPVNNVCFYGSCSYYCDTNHAICGKPDMLEGSFATFLPSEDLADRVTWRNPWKRSYSKRKKAYWELNNDLCDFIKQEPLFKEGRRLLDIIDMHIFDFLQGNMDRHHYETFQDFGNNTFYLHYDNGRGFGKTKHDEMSILAPLYQCCQINYSTFIKLVKLYLGPERLSTLLRTSLAKDSLNPILTGPHLHALDRRVVKILKEVYKCLKGGKDVGDVIIDKSY